MSPSFYLGEVMMGFFVLKIKPFIHEYYHFRKGFHKW